MEKNIAPTQSPHTETRGWSEWLTTFPVFLLLALTLVIGTGEMIHGQLLRMGEVIFGDEKVGIQYSFLRADPALPTCDVNPNIDQQVQEEMSKKSTGGDDIDALFADEVKNPEQIKASLLQAKQVCIERHTFYTEAQKHLTVGLRIYRGFEQGFFAIFKFGTENRSLILVVMLAIAAIRTTIGRHHIALRPPTSQMDFKVYNFAMTFASALLVYSSVAYWFSQQNSGVELHIIEEAVNLVWILMFVALTIFSLISCFKKNPHATEGGNVFNALLSIPLYAWMAIISGVAFIFFMHYPTGLQIYLGQLMDFSAMYLQLALYIWAGVLLKYTSLMDRFLDIVRPFNLAPETLTLFIMLGAAACTAYTGASGIFVVAAGGLIYKEVVQAGARPQYALAASAMSGSLGVVLSPCLLIVLIAAMNKQVTTDELFDHGWTVFVFSAILFYVVSLFFSGRKINFLAYRVPKNAFKQTMQNMIAIVPYLVICTVVILTYRYALNTKLDEFTAPLIIPLVMFAIVIYDNFGNKIAGEVIPVVDGKTVVPVPGVAESVRNATSETVGHIGALVLLMALSISIGGFVEKSEMLMHIPADLGGIFPTLVLCTIVLMLIGMTMDPYGALILVSATIAPMAYNNGVHPAHFWMIALAAFEFGYLCPPVALNQLLARQSVGEEEIARVDESVKNARFYLKYERWLLPLIVMGICLLSVAFIPYFAGMFGWYQG